VDKGRRVAERLPLSVNSAARAARGRAMLEPVLAGLARAPLVERQSIEQMMASSREHSEQDIVRLPPDEERSIVHQALTDHYRNTLDEPIPALGNQTPRKAVKTAKGRKKVIAWPKMLENQSAQPRFEDPMGAYDFTWLWRELGVGDERRWPDRGGAFGNAERLKITGIRKARHLGQRMANALPSPGPKSLWPILVVRASLTAR